MVDPDAIQEEPLRLLASHLSTLTPVASVAPFPTEKPDRVVVHFHGSRYPEPIDGVRLELRLRYSGAFNATYVEAWAGDRWACQWDRHENPHNARDHLHVPPTVRAPDAFDAAYPDGFRTVVEHVLAFVEERNNRLWTDDLTYPGGYAFTREYETLDSVLVD